MTEFSTVQARALEIQKLFEKRELTRYGRNWTREEIAQGLVGDVGDLMKVVLVKSGVRDIENADDKLAHELADILWSVFVLADKYGVDLEKTFNNVMDGIEKKIGGSTQ